MPAAGRLAIDDLIHTDDDILHVTVRYGYLDDPDLPRAFRQAVEAGLQGGEPERVSWFLSTIDLHLGSTPGMPRWQKRLFLATSGISVDAAEYFRLPAGSTVMMGARIDI